MFFELKDGSLLNLNQAWKIGILNGSRVIAEYGDTYAILYEGSSSECQAFLDKLKSSLPFYTNVHTNEMNLFLDKGEDLVAEFKTFMEKLEKAKYS